MRDSLTEILTDADSIVKTAARHNYSLSGNGFYASKFSELHAESVVAFKKLENQLRKFDDKAVKNGLKEIIGHLVTFFGPKNKVKDKREAKKQISFILRTVIDPAMTTSTTHSPSDDLFPLDLVRETRGYIERIAEQACGCYDQGWYDASAVMVRRLLEILNNAGDLFISLRKSSHVPGCRLRKLQLERCAKVP